MLRSTTWTMEAAHAQRPRVTVFNRSYWPDAEATGQLLTELCEDLAQAFEMTVVVGQPNQNPEGLAFRRRGGEQRAGVYIRRVWHTTFPKSFLPGRAFNLLTYLMSATWAALRLPRPQIVVVETDPPLLCLLGALLQWRYRAKLVIYLQDIYPDLAVALGKLRAGWLARMLRKLMFATYRRADRVIVLSEEMRRLLIDSGVTAGRIEVIPNWIDTAEVLPCKTNNAFRARHGWHDDFIVMYSGNLGLCQGWSELLDAVALLRDLPRVRFVLIGDGASKAALEQRAAALGLQQVTFLPYEPRPRLGQSLSAADLHLVPLDPRVVSLLMPSKLYGILASATPIVVVAPPTCELAQIVVSARVGRAVPPGDPAMLAEAIRWGLAHPRQLTAMGERARLLAECQFDRTIATNRFAGMLKSLIAQAGTLAPALRGERLSASKSY